jgi:murein DD-endopeptidase MepM/ murein hydrolase activator NlpD
MRGQDPRKRFTNLGKVTTPFGGKTTQEPVHPGVDIAAAQGTPIKTPERGIVSKVDNSHSGVDNSFGNTVEIKTPKGDTMQFHHLQGANVQPGQQVSQGQPIAKMGATGAVYSPSGGDPSNLDFRIVDRYHRYKNPTGYINKL